MHVSASDERIQRAIEKARSARVEVRLRDDTLEHTPSRVVLAVSNVAEACKVVAHSVVGSFTFGPGTMFLARGDGQLGRLRRSEWMASVGVIDSSTVHWESDGLDLPRRDGPLFGTTRAAHGWVLRR